MNKHEKIEYLLRRRFGSLAPPPPMMIGSNRSHEACESDHKSYQNLLAAKAEYEQISDNELESLYKTAIEKQNHERLEKLRLEDQELFFNKPNAKADFSHWKKMAIWSLDEAIALSLGKNPYVVNFESVSDYGDRYVPEAWNISSFRKQYARYRDLVSRARKAGQLCDPIKPTAFIAWASEVFENLPGEMIAPSLEKDSPHTFTTSIELFPAELRAAIEAFEAVRNDTTALAGRSPRKALENWLEKNKPEIGANARNRIATVANWQPVGGAPKTPG